MQGVARAPREMRVYTVAMYNSDGIVLRFDDTVAVSAKQAINNIRWRWRGVEGVHYEIAQRSIVREGEFAE